MCRLVINIGGTCIVYELVFLYLPLIKQFRIFISVVHCAVWMLHLILFLVLFHPVPLCLSQAASTATAYEQPGGWHFLSGQLLLNSGKLK